MRTHNALRALARSCLPGPAFLRVDRGDALYVSDCACAAGALLDAGFGVRTSGRLIRIAPTRALFPLIEGMLPPVGEGDALLRKLSARNARPVSDEEVALVTRALKLIEQGSGPDPGFEKKLRQVAAVCLRSGCGGALALLRKIQLTAEEVAL